jgi:hypothetical protein
MDKEKIQELNTLLDGLEIDKQELQDIIVHLNWKIRDIRDLLQDKKEEF